MDSQMRQARPGIIGPQPCPDLVYRGQGLATTAYEQMIIFIPRTQAFKDGKRLVIKGDTPYLARLAVFGGYRPVSTIKIKMLPAGTQGLIETRPG